MYVFEFIIIIVVDYVFSLFIFLIINLLAVSCIFFRPGGLFHIRINTDDQS